MRLSRTVYRHLPLHRDDEEPLGAEVIRIASTYGRNGYRLITGMMRNTGWGQATTARVARIWKGEGLKIPKKLPHRGSPLIFDCSCLRFGATEPNHVWNYVPQGFLWSLVLIRDVYGGKVCMLTLMTSSVEGA